jgi:hypothetical protein
LLLLLLLGLLLLLLLLLLKLQLLLLLHCMLLGLLLLQHGCPERILAVDLCRSGCCCNGTSISSSGAGAGPSRSWPCTTHR